MDLRLEIKISAEDVNLLLPETLAETLETFCPNCKQMRGMNIQEFWLNHIGDVTVEGHCTICQTKLSHYLDTGSDLDRYDQAMAIRELKMEVLNDYEARPYKPQQY